MPVHDKVERHALRYPQQQAVTIADSTLSWQQLWQYSQALYQHILRQPLDNHIVAIATGNTLAFPVAWLAASAQPLTAAIIDPQSPDAQRRDILRRLMPDLLLVNPQDRQMIAIAESLAIRWQALDYATLCNLPLVPDNDTFSEGMHDDTPFLINFTSGTTRLPKAFIRSRRSWRSSMEKGEAIFQLADAPSTLFPGPLSQGIGLYCLTETLYSGGHFYSPGRWQPDAVLALIASRSIQRLVVVPTMIAAFAQAAEEQAFPTLRHLLSAGAKLELNHYRQARALFPSAQIQEYYGASELGFIAVSTLDDNNINESLASVGLAFPVQPSRSLTTMTRR